MPFGNGTGPMGMGPMTGRGMGFCAVPAYGAGAGAPYSYAGMGYPYGATAPYGYAGTGYPYRPVMPYGGLPYPGLAQPWFSRGFGLGFGRGFGRGWGRGFGRGGGRGRGRWFYGW